MKIGSRNHRLWKPSFRFAAALSSSLSVAGWTWGKVKHDTNLSFFVAQVSQDINCQAVGEQKVVSNLQCNFWVFDAGCVMSPTVTDPRNHPRFIVCHPLFHPIAKPMGNDSSVVSEVISDISVRPTADVLERLGQIQMVKRDERFNSSLK